MQLEDLIELYGTYESGSLAALTVGTQALRTFLRADYVSSRTLCTEVAAYNQERFPKKNLFRLCAYLGSNMARHIVNLKLQSTDERGLPPVDPHFDDSSLEGTSYQKSEIDEVIRAINNAGVPSITDVSHGGLKELFRQRREKIVIHKNLIGSYTLSAQQGGMMVTPLPPASRLNSAGIGIGDTSDFFKAQFLRVLFGKDHFKR